VLIDIKSIKTRHVLFIDDNFIGCPEYTNELLENFKGMDLKWSAAVTTKIGDHPDLGVMIFLGWTKSEAIV
jgi:hypothetical protein